VNYKIFAAALRNDKVRKHLDKPCCINFFKIILQLFLSFEDDRALKLASKYCVLMGSSTINPDDDYQDLLANVYEHIFTYTEYLPTKT
jgi:hypothetical protein